jgi:hypothetical protein
VHAIAQTVTSSEQIEIGRRIANPAATGTTITGLSASETYDVEVVSVSAVGQTFPAVHALPQVDTTPPVVTATPAGGSFAVPQSVTLSSNEAGSQIFYTLDGSDPLDQAGDPTPAAVHYTAPISVAASARLQAVAFDPSGNASDVAVNDYTITNTPTPAAPVFGQATVGQGSVTLSWTSDDPSVTGFGVQVYDQAGVTVGGLRETTASPLTVSGLAADTPYFFTIKAQNLNGYGPESAKFGPLTPQGAVVANAGPDQTITRRATTQTVTLTGAASTTTGATYQWAQILTGPTDPDKVTLTGTTTLTPSFVLPLYAYPMTNNPPTFRLSVTTAAGTKADEVQVKLVPDQVAITTARWKTGDFRVDGTDTLIGTTVTVHQGSLAGPVLVVLR